MCQNSALFGNRTIWKYFPTLFGNHTIWKYFQHYLEIDIIWKSSTSLFRKILFGTRARSAPEEKIKLFGKTLFGTNFENIIWELFPNSVILKYFMILVFPRLRKNRLRRSFLLWKFAVFVSKTKKIRACGGLLCYFP